MAATMRRMSPDRDLGVPSRNVLSVSPDVDDDVGDDGVATEGVSVVTTTPLPLLTKSRGSTVAVVVVVLVSLPTRFISVAVAESSAPMTVPVVVAVVASTRVTPPSCCACWVAVLDVVCDMRLSSSRIQDVTFAVGDGPETDAASSVLERVVVRPHQLVSVEEGPVRVVVWLGDAVGGRNVWELVCFDMDADRLALSVAEGEANDAVRVKVNVAVLDSSIESDSLGPDRLFVCVASLLCVNVAGLTVTVSDASLVCVANVPVSRPDAVDETVPCDAVWDGDTVSAFVSVADVLGTENVACSVAEKVPVADCSAVADFVGAVCEGVDVNVFLDIDAAAVSVSDVVTVLECDSVLDEESDSVLDAVRDSCAVAEPETLSVCASIVPVLEPVDVTETDVVKEPVPALVADVECVGPMDDDSDRLPVAVVDGVPMLPVGVGDCVHVCVCEIVAVQLRRSVSVSDIVCVAYECVAVMPSVCVGVCTENDRVIVCHIDTENECFETVSVSLDVVVGLWDSVPKLIVKVLLCVGTGDADPAVLDGVIPSVKEMSSKVDVAVGVRYGGQFVPVLRSDGSNLMRDMALTSKVTTKR
eukprot:PhM_4_TR18694/c3_g1_i1/m.98696